MHEHYAAIATTAMPVVVVAAGCAAWMSSLSHSLTLDVVMLWRAVPPATLVVVCLHYCIDIGAFRNNLFRLHLKCK